VAWIYVGGGRRADLRVPELNEALCRAWVAELVQTRTNLARCDSTADRRPICTDCGPLPGRRRG